MAYCQAPNCSNDKLPGRGSRYCEDHRGGLSLDRVNEYDYWELHALVRKIRGRAPTYDCIGATIGVAVNCTGKADHWATVHGCNGKNIFEDYIPLCISCHHEYDETHARAGMHGKSHSEETKRKMSETRRGWSWLTDIDDSNRTEFGKRVSTGKRVGAFKGPDGKQMSRVTYFAEIGISCVIN